MSPAVKVLTSRGRRAFLASRNTGHCMSAALAAGLLGLFTCAAQATSTASVPVSATVLSKNICKLTASTAVLAFGTINAASSSAATASTTLTFKCAGASPSAWYTITQNGGLYKTGPGANRMRRGTQADYLPYSLSLTPASGNALKNADITVTVQGTILPTNFQNATPGSYSDTVVLTLEP